MNAIQLEELLPSAMLNGLITIRSGYRENGPRKGKQRSITFVPDEGFNVFRAKVIRILQDKEFGGNATITENGAVFFKATKTARQVDFKALSHGNFWSLLKARWACLSEADSFALDAMARSEGKSRLAVFEFEFFVYIEPQKKNASTLRRATASRIAATTQEVAMMQQERGINLGPITAHHIAVHYARQPDGTPIDIPTDNTTRQAQALDAAMRELPPLRGGDENDVAEIEVQLFGSWVSIPIRISSLRRALRLPQHDIFSQGSFTTSTLK